MRTKATIETRAGLHYTRMHLDPGNDLRKGAGLRYTRGQLEAYLL